MQDPGYLRLIILVHLLLCTVGLHAQLINIEKSRKEAKTGIQGNIDLNVMLTQNTKQIFETGTSGLLQYMRGKHLLLGLNSLGLMRVEGDNLLTRGFNTCDTII